MRSIGRTALIAATAGTTWILLAIWLVFLAHAQAGRVRPELVLSTIGEQLSAMDTTKVRFSGWSDSEGTFRWSESTTASITLRLGMPTTPQAAPEARYHLVFKTMSANVPLTAYVRVNECKAGWINFSGHEETRSVPVKPHCLRPNAENTVLLEMPNARQPDNGDLRDLGIALQWFSLQEEAHD
jgi:hypothetical protein